MDIQERCSPPVVWWGCGTAYIYIYVYYYYYYKWANALVPPTPVNGLAHRSRCMRMCAGFSVHPVCMYIYIYIYILYIY